MALSAHLEGILNGIFLIVLGLLWRRLILSKTLLKITLWLIVYGAFANIVSVTIAAVTGYGRLMPLSGGKEGKGLPEIIISFLLITLSLSMLIACILIIIGFYRHTKKEEGLF